MQQLDWLKRDIESLKEDVDKKFEGVDTQLADIRKDVKSILQFKWQITGGTIVASLILGVIIQLAVAIAGRS